jgi:hypothetical protein
MEKLMITSHKLTRLFLAMASLVSLASLSFGQVPTTGALGAQVNQIEVSDQKPGSILVFPYYTSNAQTKADTRITISNLAGTLSPLPQPPNPGTIAATGTIIVHVFFLRGSDCQQSDMFVCLTKGASISVKASEQDPEVTGYVVAVAVNEMGRGSHANALIGNAFVSTPDVAGNYGAEAFAALPVPQVANPFGFELPMNPDNTQNLNLDGVQFDRAPDQFAVEIQSPNDATGQTIVHASVNGDIAGAAMTNVSQLGTGLVVRGDEKQGSFVRFISGNCQSVNVINAGAPRVPTGLGVFLPKGSIGTMVYNTSAGSVGLLLTPKSNAWSGIRTLHKTRTRNARLVVPVFMPVC